MSEAAERARRWRLVLGAAADDLLPPPGASEEQELDRLLTALYEPGREGSLADSSPAVARWLADARRAFPAPVLEILQRDAVQRLDLRKLLSEPDLVAALEPNVELVAALLSLSRVVPRRAKEAARRVVRAVAADLERRLRPRLTERVRGALRRSSRAARAGPSAVDLDATIRRNLHNWQPDRRALVVDRLVGAERRRRGLRDVLVCVDQSGSMARSVVHAGVAASILASLPALSTRFLAFDTEVVDLTAALADPVDLLFGVRLGGGTDLARAFGALRGLAVRPSRTVALVVSDLFDGGDTEEALAHAAALVRSGVKLLVLLALGDDGRPDFDRDVAARLSALGAPCAACTPDRLPELLARVL